jgi:hypothetical protein
MNVQYTKYAIVPAALLAGTLMAHPAHAVLQLALTINGDTFTCVDQASCDTNTAVGVLQTGVDNFAGVSFLGSSQTSTQGAINDLTTTSFQIQNNNTGTVSYQLAVGDTDYVGPVTTLSQSGSGTFLNAIGSTIDTTYYADTGNTQGADTPTDFPGVKQADSGVYTATLLSDAFSFTSTSAFSDPDLFSMTLGTSGTLTAGATLVGRSQDQIGVQTTVREPGSLLILAGALGAFTLFYRRRNGANI